MQPIAEHQLATHERILSASLQVLASLLQPLPTTNLASASGDPHLATRGTTLDRRLGATTALSADTVHAPKAWLRMAQTCWQTVYRARIVGASAPSRSSNEPFSSNVVPPCNSQV
jgi:hypothetical protein